MSLSCHQCDNLPARDGRFRRILWIALAANAVMFVVEIVFGLSARSTALMADAVDFFGDAVTYGISLAVLSMALSWRARAALFKAGLMGLYGLGVFAYAGYNAVSGAVPSATVMGGVGVAALLVNVAIAVLLFAYRRGDANMRSIWLCSRNDAIFNIAVLLAAAGVFGTGTLWPDLTVGVLMAGLGIYSAALIVRQAQGELRLARSPVHAPAE